MSAASDIDANKQVLAKFDHYVNLPAELRIKIIHEFIADFRKQAEPRRLAPFATLHSEWQHELEPEEALFGSLGLTTNDLPAYCSMLNQRRGDSLSQVLFLIPIDDEVISPDQQGVLSDVQIRSRVHEVVIPSMSRIFECVDYAKSRGPQPTRKGVELYAQVLFPEGMAVNDRRKILCDTEFDFSPLPSTVAIRAFFQVQTRFKLRRKTLIDQHMQRRKDQLLLNQPSLLSLFGRMPNVEHAEVESPSSSSQTADVTMTSQFNSSSRLKTLCLYSDFSGLPGRILSNWTSNWSYTIEYLSLGPAVNIPGLFRRLSIPAHGTGMSAWPNLQVLKLTGFYCHEGPLGPGPNTRAGGYELDAVMSAIPAALASLPRIREVRLYLRCPSIASSLPIILATLHLCSGSSELTISTRDKFLPGVLARFARDGWLGEDESLVTFWDLVSEHEIRAAVAEIQTAVETHHGQDLKVVWPAKEDRPEPQ